jgi:hypothetical protein
MVHDIPLNRSRTISSFYLDGEVVVTTDFRAIVEID